MRNWRVARAIAALPPSVILGLGLGISFLYSQPGQISVDSLDILTEARRGSYTDGHPPVIAAMWRFVDMFVAGTIGILMIQIVMFQLGLYWILRRTFSRRAAAWWATGVFVFPPVMLTMGVIWKDCLMAAGLAIGFGAIQDERRWVRLVGLLPLMFASAVRYNALAATLPIVVLLFQWQPGARALQRYAIALAAWLAITFTAFGINAALTDTKMHLWQSSLAVHDIVGTLNYVDGELPDAELEKLFAGTELRVHEHIHQTVRELYTPRDFFPIINDAKRALWALPVAGSTPASPQVLDAIARVWKELVTTYPLAYVHHRFEVMREVICLGHSRRPGGAVPRRDLTSVEDAQRLGLSTGSSWFQRKMFQWMHQIWLHVPIYAPWIYLVIALALLPLTRRHRDVFALLMSGLLLEATLCLLAPSPDYRYSHWMVICTLLSVIALTARRVRAARPQPA